MLLISLQINKVSDFKQTCDNLIDDVVTNKHNTIYTNGNSNETKITIFVNLNDNTYFTKKI